MSDRPPSMPESGETPGPEPLAPPDTEPARGRRAETPFLLSGSDGLLVGATAVAVWGVAALAACAVSIAWWLG